MIIEQRMNKVFVDINISLFSDNILSEHNV